MHFQRIHISSERHISQPRTGQFVENVPTILLIYQVVGCWENVSTILLIYQIVDDAKHNMCLILFGIQQTPTMYFEQLAGPIHTSQHTLFGPSASAHYPVTYI